MAITPKYEKVVTSQRHRLGTTQAVIECKLPANDNSDISKILCANCKSYIANTEVGEGEVNFNGFANFLVIYESSENQTQSLDYSAEFKDKFKNDKVNIGDEVSVTATVVDVNTTTNNSTNDVKVVAVVEINVDQVTKNPLQVLTGIEGDSVFVANEMATFNTLSEVINETFDVLQDVEIRDAVSQVLSVSPTAFLEKVTPKDGYITLQGGVSVNVTYLTNAEVPEIRNYQTTFDFTQEITASTASPSSVIQSMLNLLYNDLKVTTNIDNDSTLINLDIPLNYHGFVFNSFKVDAISDLFSTQNELEVTTNSVNNIVPLNSLSFLEKVNGTVVIEENSPYIDEVLGNACGNVTVANSYVNEGNLVVEGVANTTVMYLNKEMATNNSIEVEIPFSLSLMTQGLPENVTPIVSVSLGDVATRNKRGRELEVNATLHIYSDFFSSDVQAVISNAVIGEEKPETDCVLSVYIAKTNDTLWDIAKELNVSPDQILEQNPAVEFPLKGGERLVIYRQKEIMF